MVDHNQAIYALVEAVERVATNLGTLDQLTKAVDRLALNTRRTRLELACQIAVGIYAGSAGRILVSNDVAEQALRTLQSIESSRLLEKQ